MEFYCKEHTLHIKNRISESSLTISLMATQTTDTVIIDTTLILD